jgi:hypothetical protein
MSEEPADEKELQDEPFLARWSRRKQDAAEPEVAAELPAEVAAEEPAALTDADMPPLESLDENSDYQGFFSPKVTEALRQQALQKLFRSSCFNVCDGLDDYAEDFTHFEKLGNVVTAELRFRLQEEAKRVAEKAKAEALAEEESVPEAGDRQVVQERVNDSPEQTTESAHEQPDADPNTA